MFALILIGLGIAFTFTGLLLAITFLDLAGNYTASEGTLKQQNAWSPPVATGRALWAWAAQMARRGAFWRLAQRRTNVSAHALVGDVMAGATSAIEQSPQRERTDREENCQTRRFARVGVTAPEALQIADFLRENQPRGCVEAIHDRAAHNAARTRDLTAGEHQRASLTCPLLTSDESCAAYPVRPLACRGWCPMREQNPAEPTAVALSPNATLLDPFALSIGQGAEQGLAESICAAELDGRIYELNAALAASLEEPDAAQRWLRGGPAFSQVVPQA